VQHETKTADLTPGSRTLEWDRIMILFLPQALAPNVASIIASRFVQGTFACIEGPVAAGVVADLFPKAVRGPAMGTFVLTVFTAK
jgi:MFS family permease